MKCTRKRERTEGNRKTRHAALLFLAALVFLGQGWPEVGWAQRAAEAARGPNEPSGQVVVTYFHTTFRCPTCLQIERYTRETVEKDFAQDLASKRVLFRAVDVQEAENRHFIEDYSLYSKSVILSLMKNGKEIRWKNLPEIWKYAHSRDRFEQYIRTEIEAFLKELGS